MHRKLSLEQTAWVFLLVLALFSQVGNDIRNVAFWGLVCLLFVTPVSLWQWLRRDPLFWVSAAFSVYLLVTYLLAVAEWPQSQAVQWDSAGRWFWTGYFFILVVAAWLARRPKFEAGIHGFLAMALVGFIGVLAYEIPWSHIESYLDGQRFGFGYSINEGGLYLGIGLFGIAVFGPRLVRSLPRIWWWPVGLGWAALALMWLMGLIINQSRGAWLAFLVVAVVALLLALLGLRKRGWRVFTPGRAVTIGLMVAMVGSALAWKQDVIVDRAFKEKRVYRQVLVQGLDAAPVTSVTRRLHVYRWALDAWWKRPLLGWGPRSPFAFLDKSELPRSVARLQHLHNTYLAVLTRFGLVGFLLFLAQWVLIYRHLYRGYAGGRIGLDTALFLGGALAMILIWGAFDFRLPHDSMSFVVALLGGAAYAAGMQRPGAEPGEMTGSTGKAG